MKIEVSHVIKCFLHRVSIQSDKDEVTTVYPRF
jgi:hypothetical protein